jgi:hypothetical protein
MSKGKQTKSRNRNVLPDNVEQPSLFGYYCMAAKVAAYMGIGLGHAFNQYVKPRMIKDAKIVAFTPEEYDALFQQRM